MGHKKRRELRRNDPDRQAHQRSAEQERYGISLAVQNQGYELVETFSTTGKTRTPHWRFLRDGVALLHFWPTTGKFWRPSSNQKGSVARLWDVLDLLPKQDSCPDVPVLPERCNVPSPERISEPNHPETQSVPEETEAALDCAQLGCTLQIRREKGWTFWDVWRLVRGRAVPLISWDLATGLWVSQDGYGGKSETHDDFLIDGVYPANWRANGLKPGIAAVRLPKEVREAIRA